MALQCEIVRARSIELCCVRLLLHHVNIESGFADVVISWQLVLVFVLILVLLEHRDENGRLDQVYRAISSL